MRISPLNILSSILLVGTAYLHLFPSEKNTFLPDLLSVALLVFLCLITDLIFRSLIKELKRIWLFELVFLIFVGLMIYLIKSYF